MDTDLERWNDDFTAVSATSVASVDKTDNESTSLPFDEYDYDADMSHSIFDWWELVPTLVIYSLIFVLGLVGNLLIVITIARYRKMKSTTNVFLCSLASADLLLILFCIPVKLAKLFSFAWTMGYAVCKFVYYMQTFTAVCSVLTLTAMSIERYYAIVHPMRAQYVCTISQATKIIIGTWVSACLLAVPILFVQNTYQQFLAQRPERYSQSLKAQSRVNRLAEDAFILRCRGVLLFLKRILLFSFCRMLKKAVHVKVGQKITAYWCIREAGDKTVWRAHELYMLLLILIIPTVVMGVAYSAICWEIWEVTQRRQNMTPGKSVSVRLQRKPCLARSSSYSMTYINNFPAKNRIRRFFYRQSEDETPVKQVIKMLVAVVVIYVVCWTPMLVENVLISFDVLEQFPKSHFKYMRTAFHLMAYFNSCINPVIYGFMSKNFRESFRNTLCCRPDTTRVPMRSFSISQTRNSSVRYAESRFQIGNPSYFESIIVKNTSSTEAPQIYAIDPQNNIPLHES